MIYDTVISIISSIKPCKNPREVYKSLSIKSPEFDKFLSYALEIFIIDYEILCQSLSHYIKEHLERLLVFSDKSLWKFCLETKPTSQSEIFLSMAYAIIGLIRKQELTLIGKIDMFQELWKYYKMGWPVIPQNGRVPLIKDYPSYAYSLPPEDLVLSWRGTEFNGIGLILGPYVNLSVVDIDLGHPNNNSYLWSTDLDSPMIAKTQRGGYHIYYLRTLPYVKTCQIIPGVELLADGKKVTLPPSLGSYSWLSFYPSEITPLPFDMVTVTSDSYRENFIESFKSSNKTIEQLARLVPNVTEGNRIGYGVKLVSRLVLRGIEDDEKIKETIRLWNYNNTPPLEEYELETGVFGAIERFRRNGR